MKVTACCFLLMSLLFILFGKLTVRNLFNVKEMVESADIKKNTIEILLVEDSTEDAEMVIRSFHKGKIANKILHLKDGLEALNYLFSDQMSDHPKMILLDLNMPNVGGLEVLKTMKNDPSRKTIPIVVLTSSTHDIDMMESQHLGADAYIVKPVEFTNFMNTMSQLGLFCFVVDQPPTM